MLAAFVGNGGARQGSSGLLECPDQSAKEDDGNEPRYDADAYLARPLAALQGLLGAVLPFVYLSAALAAQFLARRRVRVVFLWDLWFFFCHAFILQHHHGVLTVIAGHRRDLGQVGRLPVASAVVLCSFA